MTCHLFGATPFSEPMLFLLIGPLGTQTSVKFQSNYKKVIKEIAFEIAKPAAILSRPQWVNIERLRLCAFGRGQWIELTHIDSVHWNGNVFILMKFSSLAALKVVKMTTSSAASDENFVKMTTFPFQWRNAPAISVIIGSGTGLTFAQHHTI